MEVLTSKREFIALIEVMLSRYTKYSESKDATGVASLYTKDAHVIMPDGVWKGREQIEACLATDYQKLDRPKQDIATPAQIDPDASGTFGRVTEAFTETHPDGTVVIGLATMAVALVDGTVKILGEIIVNVEVTRPE